MKSTLHTSKLLLLPSAVLLSTVIVGLFNERVLLALRGLPGYPLSVAVVFLGIVLFALRRSRLIAC